MPSALVSQPRRVLVIKLGHIGDVLVATPLITALKQAWPEAEVTALVNQGTEAMLAHNPQLSRVLVLRREHAGRLAAMRRQLGLLAQVRGGGFDLCLELSGGDRGALLSRVSGARVRVGFAPKRPHLRARAFTHLADRSGTDRHEVVCFLRQLESLGLDPGRPPLVFEPGPRGRERAAALLARAGLEPGGYALVHPTSRWMFKSWTAEGNAAVITHLARKGLPVVLTCAPAAAERDLRDRIRALLPPEAPVTDLGGELDLHTLGGLIAGARVFFGVDSAPMHMAAALGVPTVALFGPSGERMWGPWQVEHEVVAGDCAERPCGRDGCEGSKVSRCLVELGPERVTAAVDRVLARSGGPA